MARYLSAWDETLYEKRLPQLSAHHQFTAKQSAIAARQPAGSPKP
jgi:hypothetical protein